MGRGGASRFDPYPRNGREESFSYRESSFRDIDPLTGRDPVSTRDAYLRELMLRDPIMRERLMDLLDRDRMLSLRDPFARPAPSYYESR